MKKIIALLLAVIMVIGLVACGSKDAGTPDTKKDTSEKTSGDTAKKDDAKKDDDAPVNDTLRIAISSDRGTLHPLYLTGDVLNASRMMYESLWDIDAKGEYEWQLATGLEMTNEGKTWTIKLREGVYFENGNPMTADDVVFTLDLANHREGETEWLPLLDLENTKAVDDYTVEMNFFEYDISYPYNMTYLPVIDKESYDANDILMHPNGTGPYTLKEYVVNSHLTLEKKADDKYWGEPAKIQYLEFQLLAEQAQETNAVATGAIDITTIPFQDIGYLETIDGYKVDIYGNAMTRALYINDYETSVFYDNVDARLAVAYAIDTEAIVDIVYSGYAEVSRCNVAMDNVDATEDLFDIGVYGEGYNPEKAKALAESSGLVGKTVHLITNGSSDAVTIAELVQDNLKEIGVPVEITNYDAGSWLTYAFDPTACDMLIDFTSVPSRTVAQNMSAWYLYHLGGAFAASPWPGKERYEELIDGIMAISDKEELHRRYVEMCTLETEGMLWFSLVDMKSAQAYNSGLKNWERMCLGNVNYAKLSW